MRNNKKNRLFLLGNALMALSFFILAAIYLPLILLYLGLAPKPDLSTLPLGTFILSIDKIEAHAPVYLDVDPWNETKYKEVLKKGVAHAKGTAKPGDTGTVYLFAHSSDQPWNITRYNTIFLRLHELSEGDEITISGSGVQYKYRVHEKRVVKPSNVEFLLNDTTENQLILQTCWPIGTDWNRLLVFADPV